jgi:hypothetical protein
MVERKTLGQKCLIKIKKFIIFAVGFFLKFCKRKIQKTEKKASKDGGNLRLKT